MSTGMDAEVGRAACQQAGLSRPMRQRSPRPQGQSGGGADEAEKVRLCSGMGSRIAAASRVAWKGKGELMQIPWMPQVRGTILTIDLWSGVAGAVMATLALGVHLVAVTLEVDKDAEKVAPKHLLGPAHGEYVEDFKGEFIVQALERPNISVRIVGRGSPCQGNPKTNRHRSGPGDERSWPPLEPRRIYDEFMDLDIVKKKKKIPFVGWLGNAASAPHDVKEEYERWSGAARCRIEAGTFGYVDRKRCFGAAPQKAKLNVAPRCPPENIGVDWSKPASSF